MNYKNLAIEIDDFFHTYDFPKYSKTVPDRILNIKKIQNNLELGKKFMYLNYFRNKKFNGESLFLANRIIQNLTNS